MHINQLLIMLIHILNKFIWEMMEMKVLYIHQAFEKDQLVNFESFITKKKQIYYDYLGTASSDGSIRSMVTTASGPPLAPSFLSSLVSNPPTSIPPPIPSPPVVPASSSHYTRVELSNVHFVHSLALLEHVVCSKQARQIIFPFTLSNDKQSNT